MHLIVRVARAKSPKYPSRKEQGFYRCGQTGSPTINPRIFTSSDLVTGTTITLPRAASHHLCQVLRLEAGASLTLFNGDGQNYCATIATTGKSATLDVITAQVNRTESVLALHLVQAISRGDRMDTTIQKAVELGVTSITPVLTSKTAVKLPPDRLEKKKQHWSNIVIGACEQSNRSVIPVLHPPVTLQQFLTGRDTDDSTCSIVLSPVSTTPIGRVIIDHPACRLLVGPESGLTGDEINACTDAGFINVSLGPRILRTETAGPAALAILQAQFGDLR